MLTREISAHTRQPANEIRDAIAFAKQQNEEVMLFFGDVFTFINKNSKVEEVMPELYEKMNFRNLLNWTRPKHEIEK